MDYDWPGNIRELRNTIERAFILETGQKIGLESLSLNVVELTEEQDSAVTLLPTDYGQAKESFEKEFLLRALRRTKGNISAAAEEMGIPRKTLYRKIEEYAINVDDLHQAHEALQKNLLVQSLKQNGGNIAATARELGVPRASIYRRLKLFGLDPAEPAK
jgi:DNA-binding NtrC family response regulator